MNSAALRIVVSGYMAQYPLGGVAWDYLQFFLGLRRLGHDVYYVEDTGQWPYNPSEGGLAEDDCSFNVGYLADLFSRFDADDRWAYRFFWNDRWFGLSDAKRREVFATADLVVNVSGSIADPEPHRNRAIWVYVDTDPVFTQIKLAKGNRNIQRQVDAHDVLYTIGETMSDQGVDDDRVWRPMRHPIVVSEWQTDRRPRATFTTVMNWTSYKDVEYEGKVYGQKDVELKRLIELPSLVPAAGFELAVNEGKTRRLPRELLEHKGWRIVDPAIVCPDLDSYRDYIQGSFGEWSVAKGGYVAGRSGWFSGRSAAYLAAGRPVVVQDTGFSETLPVGEGILPFNTMAEASAGVEEVMADWNRHSIAAAEIAVEYFSSDTVLAAVVEHAMSASGGRPRS